METDLIQRLKLFHNLGAATAKAPSPFVVGLVLGTSRSSWFADCRSLAAVHAFKRSSKSGWVCPSRHLKSKQQNFNINSLASRGPEEGEQHFLSVYKRYICNNDEEQCIFPNCRKGYKGQHKVKSVCVCHEAIFSVSVLEKGQYFFFCRTKAAVWAVSPRLCLQLHTNTQ